MKVLQWQTIVLHNSNQLKLRIPSTFKYKHHVENSEVFKRRSQEVSQFIETIPPIKRPPYHTSPNPLEIYSVRNL